MVDKTGIYLVDRPNSAQSVVAVGQVGIDRMNPDYFPVVVMNTILGGGITSRISMNLRGDKGYTLWRQQRLYISTRCGPVPSRRRYADRRYQGIGLGTDEGA